MQTNTIIVRFNVQWVLVGYCYFVWFNLFPVVIYQDFLSRFVSHPSLGHLLWFMGGIAVLSGYIGFRSRGFTLLEPGISAVLYVWTIVIMISFSMPRTPMLKIALMVISSSIIAFAVALIGALVGEYVQALGMRKAESRIQ